MSEPTATQHQPLYDLAEAYDIAFDFRDLTTECDALNSICEKHRVGKPISFLDIACGTGYHCIEYANRGLRSVGLDLNTKMLEYADEKAKQTGVPVEFMRADMRDYALTQPVDLAFCAMASFHYLLTNDEIVRHLCAVAQNLTPSGLYIIEAEHPRDMFGLGQSLKTDWKQTRGDTTVHTRWGNERDRLDPITQINTAHVRIEVTKNGNSSMYDFTSQPRVLTHQEFMMAIEKADVFETVDWLGKLDPDQPFDDSRDSYRMMPVLQKLPL